MFFLRQIPDSATMRINKSFKQFEEDVNEPNSGLKLTVEDVNNRHRILAEEEVTMILRYGLSSKQLKELS